MRMNSYENRKMSVLFGVRSVGAGIMIRSKDAGGWQRRTEGLCYTQHDARLAASTPGRT